MADTPTSESKAGDTERGDKGPDRDRRRGGRKGRGRGKGEGDRQESKGPRKGGGRDSRGRDGRGSDNRGRDNRGRDDRGRDDRGRDDRRDRRSEQPLTAGLFAGVADREMPCRIAGCTSTWTWYGTQQIRSLGKPEPKRMCTSHLAQLEGIGDKQMPCRNSWCTNTWQWSRGAQLYQRERQEKLKPPHRLCEQCFEEDKTTEDTQIECKIPECRNTWVWPRQAQLRHRAWVRRQQAKLEAEEAEEAREVQGSAAAELPPVADGGAEAQTAAVEVEAQPQAAADPAEVEAQAAAVEVEAQAAEAQPAADAAEGPADAAEAQPATAEVEAQPATAEVKAQPATAEVEAQPATAEVEAQPATAEAESVVAEQGEAEGRAAEVPAKEARTRGKSGKSRKRKRRRRRKIHDGPPEKLCERCFERVGHLEPIDIPCKVHGCTSTWSWDREGQLRAWASLDSREQVTELPQPPRRMCHGCFEFVRAHGDRGVVCGRPDCEKTWIYKTGAQLQDFLAGRTRDPIRLCDDCSREQFILSSSQGVQMPAGAEVMPCQTPGCEESWVYVPGMRLSPADPDAGSPGIDRLCDDCRGKRGAPGRDPRRVSVSSDERAPSERKMDEPAAGEGEVATSEGEVATSGGGEPTGEGSEGEASTEDVLAPGEGEDEAAVAEDPQ